MTPKRIIIATIIFALLFAGFTAAAGFGNGTPTQDLPATFSVPEKRVGDAGTYEAFRVHGKDVDGPYPYLRFEILPDATQHDRTGVAHHAHVERQALAGWIWNSTHHYVYDYDFPWDLEIDVASGDLTGVDLDLTSIIPHATASSSIDQLGLIETRTDGDASIRAQILVDITTPAPFRHCLISNQLQGQTFDPRTGTPVLTDCTLSALGTRDGLVEVRTENPWNNRSLPSASQTYYEPQTFQGVGVTEDGQLILESSTSHARAVRLWFDAANPYPVQMAFEDDVHDEWIIARMIGFERGTQAYAKPAPKPNIDVHLSLYPALPYGLPEDNLTHDFPPSEAYAAARADDESGAWFDAHPQARLVSLEGHRRAATDAIDHITWTFEFADSADSFAVEVAKAMDPISQATNPLPPNPVLQSNIEVREVQRHRTVDAETLSAPMSPVPRIADALRLFEQFSGDREGHKAWVLSLVCKQEVNDDCVRSGWHINAGIQEARTDIVVDPDPAVGGDYNFLMSWLSLGNDDIPDALMRIAYDYGYRQGPAGAGGEAPDAAAVAPPTAAANWAMPGAPVLASGGLIAALIALGYLFFPTLKMGVMGLFSRIQGPRVLENPVRMRLMNAVEEQPGIHFQEIIRLTESGHGATEHHLRKLVNARLITRHHAGGYVCYFPARTDRHFVATAPALKSEKARAVLGLVLRKPGITGGALATELHVNRATVSHHMQRLGQAGLVDAEKTGRGIRYRPTPLAARLQAR